MRRTKQHLMLTNAFFHLLQVSGMGDQAPLSAQALPQVLSYLAEVVVQDACDLLSSKDANTKDAAEACPVHVFLLQHADFK